MADVKLNKIIKSFIVTGFTLVAALIWRDVFVDVINYFLPSQNVILFKILITFIVTILLVVGIYILLKTEEETEHVFYRFFHNGKNGNKK